MLVDTSQAADGAIASLQRMLSMDVPRSAPATARAADASAMQQLFGYAPAAAADWRLNLLRTGNLTEEAIKSIDVPTVVLCSMKDRLFPSMQEGELAPCTGSLSVMTMGQWYMLVNVFKAFVRATT